MGLVEKASFQQRKKNQYLNFDQESYLHSILINVLNKITSSRRNLVKQNKKILKKKRNKNFSKLNKEDTRP